MQGYSTHGLLAETALFTAVVKIFLSLQFTSMIFIYLQSFIHHFTGLFETNIMISPQLALSSVGSAEVKGLSPVQA